MRLFQFGNFVRTGTVGLAGVAGDGRLVGVVVTRSAVFAPSSAFFSPRMALTPLLPHLTTLPAGTMATASSGSCRGSPTHHFAAS